MKILIILFLPFIATSQIVKATAPFGGKLINSNQVMIFERSDDNNKSELNPLSVFPNPIFNELLTFNFLEDVIIESISVLNNEGKILNLEENRISNGNQINLDGFSNGNYMLIIKAKNGKDFYSQFIINK